MPELSCNFPQFCSMEIPRRKIYLCIFFSFFNFLFLSSFLIFKQLSYSFPILLFFLMVKFTYHKRNHSKVCSSVVFSTFIMLCNYPLYLVLKYFHHPKENPAPIKQSLPFSPPPVSDNYQLAFCLYGFI